MQFEVVMSSDDIGSPFDVLPTIVGSATNLSVNTSVEQ